MKPRILASALLAFGVSVTVSAQPAQRSTAPVPGRSSVDPRLEAFIAKIRAVDDLTHRDPTEVERRRCAEICRRRAELWRKTSLASSSIASVREEARARANEAAYLADLLESGADLSKDADGGAADVDA